VAKRKYKRNWIESFDFKPGQRIARKYEIISKLGSGWEGEVYKVLEVRTGIERAAKLFFPHRNRENKNARLYARKLHQLEHCRVLIHYYTEEEIIYHGKEVTVLISEYVDGSLLSEYLDRLPGKRMPPYQALHLLYALVEGIERIHLSGEYHGDLHTDNIIVTDFGLTASLKLMDLYLHDGYPKKENRLDDICNIIRIFYDCIGGSKHYSRSNKAVKSICCGLRRSIIQKKFRTASMLREHIETVSWE